MGLLTGVRMYFEIRKSYICIKVKEPEEQMKYTGVLL